MKTTRTPSVLKPQATPIEEKKIRVVHARTPGEKVCPMGQACGYPLGQEWPKYTRQPWQSERREKVPSVATTAAAPQSSCEVQWPGARRAVMQNEMKATEICWCAWTTGCLLVSSLVARFVCLVSWLVGLLASQLVQMLNPIWSWSSIGTIMDHASLNPRRYPQTWISPINRNMFRQSS